LKAKTQFLVTPGSERIYHTMKRDGFIETFEAMGGTVLANACGPCIGQWKREDVKKGESNSIISSFNRNFPGRNDGNRETLSFLSSPEIVTVMAFSGDLHFNPLADALSTSAGTKVQFEPPQGEELPPNGFAKVEGGYVAPAEDGDKVMVEVSPDSERLQLLKPFKRWDGNDFNKLSVLLKVKGKCTTDHISPAGPWLRYRGHLDKISDNMFLGANNVFTSEAGKANDTLSGETNLTPSEVARRYQAKGVGMIVVGDENYGEGSSREHAAMSPRFLGIKVAITKSFARIHETNLKKQGVLPLTFANPADWDAIEENDRVSVVGLAGLAPGKQVALIIHKADGKEITIQGNHSLAEKQIGWFKAGSALNALGE
ncbi:MAG: aconitase family protein, partial [Nitrospiria bacterium]